MRKKKLFSVLLASIITISMMSCGTKADSVTKEEAAPKEDSAAAENSADEAGETAAESQGVDGFYTGTAEGGEITDQFSILVGWQSESPEITTMQEAIKEKLGIDFKCEYIQNDDIFTTINMRLSSGDELPDIILIQNNQEVANTLIGSGRILKLNDIYASDKLVSIPNIDARIQEYIKDENGDMWYIPGWYAMEYDDPWPGWTVDAWWVRTDLMEQTGVTQEDISTIEGLEEALRKFAGCKDENGNAVIPLSFYMGDNQMEERIIEATFGVDTASGVSGMPAVMREGDEFVFIYDNPKYKEAYVWMNRMYREGLIDMEVTTMQAERYKEKVRNGQVAVFTTDMWDADPFGATNEDNTPKWPFEPFDSPRVAGVEKGYTAYVNPNPGNMVFINSDTEHLNAVLNFLEWCNEPAPYRQFELNEGPIGVLWDVNENNQWRYVDEEYEAAKNSGDSATVAAARTELYGMTSYSNSWYPWWEIDMGTIEGYNQQVKNIEICKNISQNIVNHRVISELDQVKLATDSTLGSNLANLNAVVTEYEAKMIMAKSDEEFEKIYDTYQSQLELRAEWSTIKEEWLKAYQEQFGQ